MGGAVELVSLADISPSHGWRGSLSQVLSPAHGSRAQEHKCVQHNTTEQQGGAGDLLRRRTRGAPPRSSGHRQLQVLRSTPPDTLDQTRAAENKDVL